MLGLERVTRNYVKYYNYEQNTAWLRQRFVDTLSYYFDSVKTNDGIAERGTHEQLIESGGIYSSFHAS